MMEGSMSQLAFCCLDCAETVFNFGAPRPPLTQVDKIGIQRLQRSAWRAARRLKEISMTETPAPENRAHYEAFASSFIAALGKYPAKEWPPSRPGLWRRTGFSIPPIKQRGVLVLHRPRRGSKPLPPPSEQGVTLLPAWGVVITEPATTLEG
jgi:hypothetical protein